MSVIPAALVVIVVSAFFLFRRTDVRLVLILAAAAMFFVHATQGSFAGKRLDTFSQFFTEFAAGLVSPTSVIPICSAMGFAYVCKLTDCDAHLVHLLCNPLRRVRWLLIPGGIAVAFFVNSAIVSQTSTVSVVGPVLIPILIGAGISRQTAGALLLLGGSMGGELLNPAAVEVGAINGVTHVDRADVIHHMFPYNMVACATALLVFWLMALRHERALKESGAESLSDDGITFAPGSIAATMATNSAAAIERVNIFKAIVPLVPIVLLMFVKPNKHVHWPGINEQESIAAAMLVGVVCAAFSSLRKFSRVAAAFFEGAGFAYAHIISVIVAATMFAKSIEANGLIDLMKPAVAKAPSMAMAASVVIPWLMAAITGTAVGTAPLVIQILLPVAMGSVPASRSTEHGLRAGAVNAIAAQFGRTTSPVAPVVIMCATLARSRPVTLVKRILIPLLAGGIMLFVAALFRWF